MGGPRCDRILAGTALALILAAPFGVSAQEVAKQPGKLPGSATAAVPTGPISTSNSSSSTAAAPASEQPSAPADPAAAPPAAAPEPAPDPLAALDPAERPFGEKIRDLLAAKADG